MLDRDSLLKNRRPVIRVMIPELDGEIGLRALSGAEASQVYERHADGSKLTSGEINRRLLILSICDDDGRRLLTEADVDALFDQPAPVISKLVEKASEINGWGDLSAARKTSGATDANASGTGSPTN